MNPARVDITMRRNVPFTEEWTFQDEKGRVFDFTGWTGKMEIRQYGAAPGAAELTLTTGNGLQNVYFPPNDRTIVRIGAAAAAINALPGPSEAGSSASFVYDLVLTDPTGFSQAFREGAVIVEPGVTR